MAPPMPSPPSTGAAGTALCQIAQEDGVVDGRGRVILESETAADAIAAGAAMAPMPPIAVLIHHATLLESTTLPPLLKMPPPAARPPPLEPVALLLLIVLEATLSVPAL